MKLVCLLLAIIATIVFAQPAAINPTTPLLFPTGSLTDAPSTAAVPPTATPLTIVPTATPAVHHEAPLCRPRKVMGTDAEHLAWAMFGTTLFLGLTSLALGSLLAWKWNELNKERDHKSVVLSSNAPAHHHRDNMNQNVHPAVVMGGLGSSRR